MGLFHFPNGALCPFDIADVVLKREGESSIVKPEKMETE